MTYILTEDGTLKKDDRNYLNRASSKNDLFDALCLQVTRSEAAESRAAQLEGERDAAWRELRELQSHHTSIVLALYEIDEEVFGPLTVKEGIAELKQQRDTARADIVRYQDERVTLLGRIETLAVENKQLQSEINYLRSTDHAADLAFEHAQKIGARYVIDETPLGQSLDGQGDEVEP